MTVKSLNVITIAPITILVCRLATANCRTNPMEIYTIARTDARIHYFYCCFSHMINTECENYTLAAWWRNVVHATKILRSNELSVVRCPSWNLSISSIIRWQECRHSHQRKSYCITDKTFCRWFLVANSAVHYYLRAVITMDSIWLEAVPASPVLMTQTRTKWFPVNIFTVD